jgi:Na+/H+ antiporter NhaC
MRTLAVDIGGLVELVWFAPLAAVLVTATFSACVAGATKSTDSRRAGAVGEGFAWLAVAVAAGAATIAMVVVGILVIVTG